MYRSVAGRTTLLGRTVLLIDVSGSMGYRLAHRSEMLRMDAACGVAVLLREIAETIAVYSFSDRLERVPSRRGFALRDAIVTSRPHSGMRLGFALESLREQYDRIIGEQYIRAMTLAGEYAYAGRDWVCERVARLLGAPIVESVHNHHNFAWREDHGGEQYWVVRKGATPAFPGQKGFVGGTMAEPAVILEGIESEESKLALYSTIHGAGRVMGRREATGLTDRKTGEVKRAAKITRAMLDARVAEAQVTLRGAGVDESPHCYKRLDEVIAAQGPSVRVLHTLTPVGVAMAGANEFDPYKD
jgi:tRNA-splicing ligase RtcB